MVDDSGMGRDAHGNPVPTPPRPKEEVEKGTSPESSPYAPESIPPPPEAGQADDRH